MIIKSKSRLQRRIEARAWHRWFAWHPVRISDTEVAWLEEVERRVLAYGFDDEYEYRRVP